MSKQQLTKNISFPSEQFPAYPAISLNLPDGWEPMIVPGMILAVGAPVEPGVFRPNVVVAVSRFAAGYQLQVAIDAVVQKFSSLDQAQEIGRDLTTVNGTEWSHIESSFIDPRAGTLVQSSHLCILDHGPVVDLVQVTGTVTGSQAHGVQLGEVRDIQRSATVSAG